MRARACLRVRPCFMLYQTEGNLVWRGALPPLDPVPVGTLWAWPCGSETAPSFQTQGSGDTAAPYRSEPASAGSAVHVPCAP